MIKDQRELVAADPAGHVGGADQPGEQPRDMDQGSVAGEVPVTLVDRLEAFEIDVQDRGLSAVAVHLRSHALKLADEPAAIGERRQRIGVGDPLDLLQPLARFGQRGAEQCILVGKLRHPARASALTSSSEKRGMKLALSAIRSSFLWCGELARKG
jgi:hypothetical protein